MARFDKDWHRLGTRITMDGHSIGPSMSQAELRIVLRWLRKAYKDFAVQVRRKMIRAVEKAKV